jgi:hypothetical protein
MSICADFLVVAAVSLNRSLQSISLFIREIARSSSDSWAVRRSESRENVDKAPTFQFGVAGYNREFLAKIQGNLCGEQGFAAARFEQHSPIGKALTSQEIMEERCLR